MSTASVADSTRFRDAYLWRTGYRVVHNPAALFTTDLPSAVERVRSGLTG